MKKSITAATVAALLLSACATSPDDITAQYVSPVLYRNLNCDQIAQELIGIGDRVAVLSGQQRRRASEDKWAVAGAVILWPSLFFLMRGDKSDELSRLKGQYEALHLVAQEKNCQGAPTPSAS
jgi:hypothetical protein